MPLHNGSLHVTRIRSYLILHMDCNELQVHSLHYHLFVAIWLTGRDLVYGRKVSLVRDLLDLDIRGAGNRTDADVCRVAYSFLTPRSHSMKQPGLLRCVCRQSCFVRQNQNGERGQVASMTLAKG